MQSFLFVSLLSLMSSTPSTIVSALAPAAVSSKTIVVGLNAALQKRFILPAATTTSSTDDSRLIPGQVHRAARVTTGVGGKGQDVACTLSCLQYYDGSHTANDINDQHDCHDVQLAQFLGMGAAGDTVYGLLQDILKQTAMSLTVRTESSMRTCTSIVASDCTTELVEPSGIVTDDEWNALLSALQETTKDTDTSKTSTTTAETTINSLCFMGSLPPGCPPNAYAQIYQRVVAPNDNWLCLIDSVVGLDTLLPCLQTSQQSQAMLKINVSELHRLVEPTRRKLPQQQSSSTSSSTEQQIVQAIRLFLQQYFMTESTTGAAATGTSSVSCPLQAIALTDGKDAAYMALFHHSDVPSSTDNSFTLYRFAVANLMESSSQQQQPVLLYPIGAGDAVAAGTLAAWQYLTSRNSNALPTSIRDVLDERFQQDASLQQDIQHARAAVYLTAFSFGLTCGSASCLQEKNSKVDVKDVVRLFTETAVPTLLSTANEYVR